MLVAAKIDGWNCQQRLRHGRMHHQIVDHLVPLFESDGHYRWAFIGQNGRRLKFLSKKTSEVSLNMDPTSPKYEPDRSAMIFSNLLTISLILGRRNENDFTVFDRFCAWNIILLHLRNLVIMIFQLFFFVFDNFSQNRWKCFHYPELTNDS